MKSKKFSKNLTLNKKTIAKLNNIEMVDLKGGNVFTIEGVTCYAVSCLKPTCRCIP